MRIHVHMWYRVHNTTCIDMYICTGPSTVCSAYFFSPGLFLEIYIPYKRYSFKINLKKEEHTLNKHTIGSTRKSTNIQDFYPQESKQPNTECDDVGYSNSPVML